MDGFIQLSPTDLTTSAGTAKLNNMLQALFNAASGDGLTVQDLSGYGSPNSVLTAAVGSTYRQIDGSSSTAFWIKTTGSGNTGWVAISIPTFPLSLANGGTGTASGFAYVKTSDTKTQNVNGGNTVSGAWTTRALNTIDNDTSGISSLTSSQLTLPAGTYLTTITSPFYNLGANLVQLRLQNITAATTLIIGQSGSGQNDNNLPLPLKGLFILASSSAVAIQYQCSGVVTNGLGIASNFTTEVYTIAEFTKIG